MRRVAGWCIVVSAVALALSGLWLTKYYRPGTSRISTWDDLPDGIERSLRMAAAIRGAHNIATIVFVLATAVYAVVVLLARLRVRGVAALALVGGGVAGFLSGIPLAWDQLALNAVRANAQYRGAWAAAFGDDIRFVLVGTAEVTQTTYRSMLLVHLVAVSAALVIAGTVLLRSRRAQPDAPAPTAAPTP